MKSRQQTAALLYAAKGYKVLPIYGAEKGGACSCSQGAECSRPAKHPMTNNGVKAATEDPGAINAYWKKWPNANVGIATGEKSGIVVLDIDPQNGGQKSLEAAIAELGSLPLTPKTRSGGGGHHYIFSYPKCGVASHTAGKRLGTGVDILSNGSYFIAPESVHATGRRYKFIKGKNIENLAPARLPNSWLSRLQGADAKLAAPDTGGAGVGDRNTTLTSLAGSLLRAGLSAQALEAALVAENSGFVPPLAAAEVRKIATSVSSYGGAAAGSDGDPAIALMKIVLDKWFDGGKNLTMQENGFWRFAETHWVTASDNWIKGRVLRAATKSGIKLKSNTASVLKQTLDLLQSHLAPTEDLLGYVSSPLPIINCVNGEVWIGGDGHVTLKPHRPKSHLRYCLPIKYDPLATCPNYDRALKEIFSAGKQPNAMARSWNELMGYIIQPRRDIPLIVVCLGKGRNGKTVLMETVTKLLGEHLVSAQEIGNFSNNRFAMGSLFGKHLLLDDDVSAGTRLPDGFLKKISEGKTQTAEQKYKNSFTFVVRALPVLLCNNVPSVPDLSFGMRRRLVVLPFEKVFSKDEVDSELFERIWSDELSGVLNRAIEGLSRVRKRGSKFAWPEAVEIATEGFFANANPLPAFIAERCKKVIGASMTMKAFYVAYCLWANANGVTMKQQQTSVRKNLEHLGFAVVHRNSGSTLLGLQLKP